MRACKIFTPVKQNGLFSEITSTIISRSNVDIFERETQANVITSFVRRINQVKQMTQIRFSLTDCENLLKFKFINYICFLETWQR